MNTFLRRVVAPLALVAPLACGGTTASPSGGDASADGGTPLDDGATCSAPKQLCTGSCVDTLIDPANCGVCSHAWYAFTGNAQSRGLVNRGGFSRDSQEDTKTGS